MDTDSPPFPSMIGGSRLWVFLAHSVAIVIGITLNRNSFMRLTPFFLAFTLLARIYAEKTFWQSVFSDKVSRHTHTKGWKSSVKRKVFSNSSSVRRIISLVIDLTFDIALLYLAYKAPIPFPYVLLVYSLGQGLGGLLQALALSILSVFTVKLISGVATATAFLFLLEINGILPTFYTNVLGLSDLSLGTIALIAVGMKSLLSGISMIASWGIAEFIHRDSINFQVQRGG